MKSVLLVEDNQAIADLFEAGLERAGWSVVHASNGPAAVRSAAAIRPDAVVLDVRLPGLGGLNVLRALRADAASRGVPVLVLSNCGEDDEDVRTALRLAPARYLLKAATTPRQVAAVLGEMVSGLEAEPA